MTMTCAVAGMAGTSRSLQNRVPAVRGGWQKGVRHEDRTYLPLTPGVLAAYLKGEVHIGLYPLLDGDKCWWLAADFDGPEAMLDALMYVKAGRALQVPVALEASRSGVGAHAWVFFTSPVPAEMARRLGTGLLREAMALRGRMTLASYDRLFPSQDLLPAGGVGNLIAAPLFKPARQNGATVFLDLETLEPREDQWAYLSTLGRMTPQELRRAASSAGKVTVAAEVTRLTAASSTKTRPPAPPVLSTRLATGIRLEQAELTPGLAATLRHAASMHNPEFYERQRMRASTYNIPRFLHCYQETIDGALVLPRGMLGTVTSLAGQAGSRVCSRVGAAVSSGGASCTKGGTTRCHGSGSASPGRVPRPVRISIISNSNAPTSARAGHALTSAPTGPCPTPCARLAPTVATMPAPRLQAASRDTGWFRRLASSTAIHAAQISPSTVNGSSRAVTPDSPCERTSS